MLKVTVHFNSTLPHFSQVFAGLEFLGTRKNISLAYHLDPGKYPVNILKLEINGKTVFFDLADNNRIDLSLYNECDFYVKRMLLKKDREQLERLIPYGLYYPVFFSNRNLKFLFLEDPSYWRYSLKYFPFLSRSLNLKDSIATNHLRRMHSEPADRKKVIFRSRLWDAGERHPEWKRDKRKLLNEERVKMNKILAKQLGSDFIGGIRRDSFSEKICSDLLLDENEFHRKNYLEVLRGCSIGITSPGLEESVGAKFGEYMAFGLAVVTNPVDVYEFLGPLENERHYLDYETPEECLEKTLLLYSNDSLRAKMQQENTAYYKEWLHPGLKLQKIIELIQTK
ncbi:hypothetical protein LZ575_08465 [Antarcticibacterium sp. 1MA-6-2]|uniref:glycosyltransferase n=1 Tax=Antarcticibacterium sp. 1MA-6-2 TaxID=2908210 RepID=UPI001F2F73C7|nr:hypothetical protein [Antarcticibacterium sp. 1MA-6-2]UJH92505.1 hypothetical protein LZ575_08465 [Antarcticibacterium sp. 1MA-6-2]